LDEEKANTAKAAAEEALKNAKGQFDIARAQSELAVMAAQISALRKFRLKK
jgi:F-type H+-transporting ATPase subunit epsilon